MVRFNECGLFVCIDWSNKSTKQKQSPVLKNVKSKQKKKKKRWGLNWNFVYNLYGQWKLETIWKIGGLEFGYNQLAKRENVEFRRTYCTL